jgi:prophage regulatory protein
METTRMPLVSASKTSCPTANNQSLTPAHPDLVGSAKAVHEPSGQPRANVPKLLEKGRAKSAAQYDEQPRIVRLPELSARLGLSVSSIYVLIAKSALPKPFALVPGGRAVGWLESDVAEFVLNRKDASTKEAV